MRISRTLCVVVSMLLLGSFRGWSQGLVYFGNASTLTGWNPVRNRNVIYDSTFPGLAGQNVASNNVINGGSTASLRVALYYAPTSNTTLLNGYVQASGGPATFKGSTSATVGSWFGGTRTLDNIPPGTTANLVVLVWDSALSPNPLDCQQGVWGSSPIFQYTPPTNASPMTSDLLMNNLTGFVIFGGLELPNFGGPADSTVVAGQDAHMSAHLALPGIGPYRLYWQFYGTNLPGSTGSSLTITNAQSANAGPYSFVVTNCYGGYTQTATLTVIQPRLAIRRTNSTQAQIAWLTNLNAYNLESASSLIGSWQTITDRVTLSNLFIFTDDTPTQYQRFFRLHKP